MATCINPEILLLDEGIGAGDASFIDKANARLDSFVSKASILVLASGAWLFVVFRRYRALVAGNT